MKITFSQPKLRDLQENKIRPKILDEKRNNAALLIKNFGSYFIRDPKPLRQGEKKKS